MAEKVLEEEKRALTSWEIMQIAENKGYDKLVDPTPSASLGKLLDADVRDNPSTVFTACGARRYTFILKEQMDDIHPGKKVRILEHVIYTIDHGIGAADVVATTGSTGTIVAYEEYRANIEGEVKRGLVIHPNHLSWVKEHIDSRTGYLIKLDEVVPPSEDDYADWNTHIDKLAMSFQVGAIFVIPIESFTVL